MERTSSGGIGPSRPWFLLALTIVMFLPSLSASAQNHYYVSVSGNDSNSGTSPGTAWRTINHAISAFSLGSSGAVIHVADGTYSTGVSVSRGGSSQTERLVIQCDNGIASAEAAEGHCKIQPSGIAFLLNGGSNFDIRGFDIGGNPNTTVAVDGLYCGSATQSTCSNSVHVLGNYIHDFAQNVAMSGGCPVPGAASGGILILNQHYHFVTDTQVIGNMLINFGPPTSANCYEMHGLYIDTKDATITNNLIVKVPTFGIQVYGQPCNEVVSNNTIITNKVGMTLSGGGEGICNGSNTVTNNILMNSLGAKFQRNQSPPCTGSTPSFFGHNVTDGIGADYNEGDAGTCTTISPNPQVHVSGESIFVNYKTDGTGDYHLKSGSALTGSGTTQCVSGGKTPCAPTFDLAGVNRANTPTPGVFEPESSSASVPAAPSGLTAVVQ